MTKAKKTSAKRSPTPTTVKSVAFRASADYSVWIEEFAATNRTTVAGLLDQALAKYAASTGFKAPPERT